MAKAKRIDTTNPSARAERRKRNPQSERKLVRLSEELTAEFLKLQDATDRAGKARRKIAPLMALVELGLKAKT